jgi:hypothetical protein
MSREMRGNLEKVEKILAAPGSRLKSAWRAAEGYLNAAEENHKTILARYSSSFDQKGAVWVKLETRLRAAQADGTAFKARIAAGGGAGPAAGTKPAPKAGTAQLNSHVRSGMKKVAQSLDGFDKTLRRARAGKDKDKAGGYHAAKRGLAEAGEQHQKITRDHSGQFEVTHPQWVAMTTRMAKAKTDLQSFYDADIDGGGTKADGSKVTGYADAQSILPASNANRSSVDRAVQSLLSDTEAIRTAYATKDKKADLVARANRSLSNAKRSMSRLQGSYGSIINKESDEYLAVVSELEQAERRIGEMPAMLAADVKARDTRDAELKLRAQLARAQSKAEQKAADEARHEAAIDSARFPSFTHKNAKLNKVAAAVVAAFYKGQTIERLQIREPYEVLREARFKQGVVEFGTYRYLRLAVILRSGNGKAQIYDLSLRSTKQPKNAWGPLRMFAGQYAGREIRSANIHK